MNEDALREMIRDAVARRLAPSESPAAKPVSLTAHVSHFRYALPPSEGPCLIEPAVPCNGCGYCESHGH